MSGTTRTSRVGLNDIHNLDYTIKKIQRTPVLVKQCGDPPYAVTPLFNLTPETFNKMLGLEVGFNN